MGAHTILASAPEPNPAIKDDHRYKLVSSLGGSINNSSSENTGAAAENRRFTVNTSLAVDCTLVAIGKSDGGHFVPMTLGARLLPSPSLLFDIVAAPRVVLQVRFLITASEWQLIILFALPNLKESDCLWHKVGIRQRGNDLMPLDMQPLNPTISIMVTRSAFLVEPITLPVFIRNTQNSSRNKV